MLEILVARGYKPYAVGHHENNDYYSPGPAKWRQSDPTLRISICHVPQVAHLLAIIGQDNSVE
ncbi:MAG: hypothetical protein JO249_15530 [Acidobacteria bacterium]|nr:hypothetical protein [Acidobacteriota bacterium]MBV9482139.1 hypothetical protein [Acidobacteriota bacterium]